MELIGIICVILLIGISFFILGIEYANVRTKSVSKKEKVKKDKYDTDIKFTIKVTMKERWIPYFLTFLKRMQADGNLGHSELIGFYADGDGDFRPKFEFEGVKYNSPSEKLVLDEPKIIEYYDAG